VSVANRPLGTRPRETRTRHVLPIVPEGFQNAVSCCSSVVFRSEGIRIVATPVRTPQANAHIERFVRTVRNECRNWLLILGHRHLARVLQVYTAHCNSERPHRGLALRPPEPPQLESPARGAIQGRDRLGGLLHEYYKAAA
jgi:putative transposase